MQRRASRKLRPDLLTILLTIVAWPLRLLYSVFVSPFDRIQEARGSVAFAEELRDTYETLLQAHGGNVVVQRGIQAFDYQSARLVFPDREVQITRGREELRALVDGVEVYVSFKKDYAEAMRNSATRLARHWDELPGVTLSDVNRWVEQET